MDKWPAGNELSFNKSFTEKCFAKGEKSETGALQVYPSADNFETQDSRLTTQNPHPLVASCLQVKAVDCSEIVAMVSHKIRSSVFGCTDLCDWLIKGNESCCLLVDSLNVLRKSFVLLQGEGCQVIRQVIMCFLGFWDSGILGEFRIFFLGSDICKSTLHVSLEMV
jgi:hypothetical protein